MKNKFELQKVLNFYLTLIVIGVLIVGGSVAFIHLAVQFLLEKSHLPDSIRNLIISFSDSAIALVSYILLFRFFEKRRIRELSFSSLVRNAITGFITGFIMQSLFILVIYLFCTYTVLNINPFSYLLPAFTYALTAGFVTEILIRGIIFRIIEQKAGTAVAIVFITIVFALMHINAAGATALSVISTAVQAGFVLSAGYVLTRSLWFPIFLHFAWDFAEPGFFGGINPGNSIDVNLISSNISGPAILTGGRMGPQNSIEAIIICLLAGLFFLWLAQKHNNIIKPFWRRV